MLAEVTSRAAAQHVMYLELMMNSDEGSIPRLGLKIGWNADFATLRARLDSAGLLDSIRSASRTVDRGEHHQRELLRCGTPAADPGCAVCHSKTDPIGFGLENYDAAGVWRTRDGNFEIDSTGTLSDGRSFAGAAGLKALLRAQPETFARNFTERLLTYALGRGLERSDAPIVNQLCADMARDNYKFGTLLTSIVTSRPFQMRSVDASGTTRIAQRGAQ